MKMYQYRAGKKAHLPREFRLQSGPYWSTRHQFGGGEGDGGCLPTSRRT